MYKLYYLFEIQPFGSPEPIKISNYVAISKEEEKGEAKVVKYSCQNYILKPLFRKKINISGKVRCISHERSTAVKTTGLISSKRPTLKATSMSIKRTV